MTFSDRISGPQVGGTPNFASSPPILTSWLAGEAPPLSDTIGDLSSLRAKPYGLNCSHRVFPVIRTSLCPHPV